MPHISMFFNEHNPPHFYAEYVSEYKIKLTFDNGVKKVADCSKGGIFEPLKDIEYFKQFFVDGWTISWPNGADIDPETLYR
ncbi:DUF2442 domain-containing protein [Candidatus Halobeggiatoa sp. HSG11]|nr:DUF2442 domain-containing protein [Candidatus Halobeggiatoa sp. HSG11]